MARFIALYPQPQDIDGFEQHMRETHLPIVERWPETTSITASRITGTPRGTDAPYHLAVVVEFPDDETMAESLRSDASREAGRDAMQAAERFGIQPVLMLGEDL